MEVFAFTIAKWLAREQSISVDAQHLYAFAICSLLWGLSPLLITIFLGITLNMVKEGIIFILSYILLRKFCGGYHLQTKTACFLASSLIIFVSLMLIKNYAVTYVSSEIQAIVVTCSVMSIWIHSPIDSEARSLSSREVKVFKWISRIISLILLLLYLIFLLNGIMTISSSLGVGIFVSAILQFPCF